jgi:hypothetical protein
MIGSVSILNGEILNIMDRTNLEQLKFNENVEELSSSATE